MAFSFGAPAPAAPAPAAGGGFSFGAPAPAAAGGATPAPAPAGGGLFGAAPAPAAAGGGLFGSTAPAPAGGGLFGAAKSPAPATGGGLFGSTAPAPATGGGLFGSTAPAPAGGGLFGSTAPAPAAGGLFGSTPAPAAGGLFGSTPAPAAGGLFGSTPAPAPAAGGLFGASTPTAAPAMQQQQHMQQPFSGNTPYSQLPDNAKRAIDQIYQLMMQHRRTLASVKTMAPALLTVDNGSVPAGGETPSPADAAAGSPRRPSSKATPTDPANEPLPQQMTALETQIQTLLQSAETNLVEARQLKTRAGEAAVRAKMHGAWPVENVAARRGVALSSIRGVLKDANSGAPTATPGAPAATTATGGTPASSLNVSGMTNIDAIALQQIMDIRAAHVDRIESMPSPYFWEVLHDFEQRVSTVHRDVEAVRARLAIAEEAERVQSMGGGGTARLDETQLLLTNRHGDNFDVMTSLIMSEGSAAASAPLPKRLAMLARSQNDLFLRIAAQTARAHEGLEEVKLRYQRYCQTTKGGYYEDPFLKADVEEVGREREMQRRIMEEQIATAPPPKAPVAAPGTPAPAGLFGAPAPASTGGGLFGTPAPAPAAGGLFGAPAPAPATGGLFGSTATPAPAPAGGLFGSTTPAPAPTGGGLFGSTTPAPAAGGGLFGSAAPAPSGNLFGLSGSAAAPAPSGSLFGAAPTTPASTLAPRKKSGSRSGGRRR